MSADRYQPNGVPLTDYERECLTILMEECAEVIHAASKLLRFGKENSPNGEANTVTLAHEIGDLETMIAMVAGSLVNLSDIHDGAKRKQERLSHYMQCRR